MWNVPRARHVDQVFTDDLHDRLFALVELALVVAAGAVMTPMVEVMGVSQRLLKAGAGRVIGVIQGVGIDCVGREGGIFDSFDELVGEQREAVIASVAEQNRHLRTHIHTHIMHCHKGYNKPPQESQGD